jgi:hypothetical protein
MARLNVEIVKRSDHAKGFVVLPPQKYGLSRQDGPPHRNLGEGAASRMAETNLAAVQRLYPSQEGQLPSLDAAITL